MTLVVEARPFEVTTLREDVETYGRKAKVAFGRDWARDAERRDFTINGLSVDAAGVVHDHVGGLSDIATRRVRFIGDPTVALPRTICASSGSSAFTPAMARANPIAPDISLALAGMPGLSHCPPNACAWK